MAVAVADQEGSDDDDDGNDDGDDIVDDDDDLSKSSKAETGTRKRKALDIEEEGSPKKKVKYDLYSIQF